MADSTDEDAVRFAQSQQIGILESEGESLGGGQVNAGVASVEAVQVGVIVPGTTEQSAVSRAIDEIFAGVEFPSDDRLVIVEERSEVQMEGRLVDVVPPGSCVASTAEAHESRKIAGFGEIDTDDSSDGESDRNSGDAPPGDSSARGDDDAGSVHSSGSDARHGLDYLEQSGGLLSYLLMAS